MNSHSRNYRYLRNLYYDLYIQDYNNKSIKMKLLKAINQSLIQYSSNFKYKDNVKSLRKYSK